MSPKSVLMLEVWLVDFEGSSVLESTAHFISEIVSEDKFIMHEETLAMMRTDSSLSDSDKKKLKGIQTDGVEWYIINTTKRK